MSFGSKAMFRAIICCAGSMRFLILAQPKTRWTEALYRKIASRRQLAAYAELASTPWRSGKIDHEQGISKAGNESHRGPPFQNRGKV